MTLSDSWSNMIFSLWFTSIHRANCKENVAIDQRPLKALFRRPFNWCAMDSIFKSTQRHILFTVLHTFLMELVRRTCLNITETYSPWWLIALFSYIHSSTYILLHYLGMFDLNPQDLKLAAQQRLLLCVNLLTKQQQIPSTRFIWKSYFHLDVQLVKDD